MAAPFTPVSAKKLSLKNVQGTWTPEGKRAGRNLGDIPSAEFQASVEQVEAMSREFEVPELVRTDVRSKGGTVTVTFRSMTADILAMQFMSDLGYVVQASKTDEAFSFADARAGDIFRLGGIGITDVKATGLVEGEDYRVIPHIGRIEILKTPSGGAISGTYSLPALTVADGYESFDGMSSNGQRGELSFVEMEDGQNKDLYEYIFPVTEARPETFSIQAGDDYKSVSITFRVYRGDGESSLYKVRKVRKAA